MECLSDSGSSSDSDGEVPPPPPPPEEEELPPPPPVPTILEAGVQRPLLSGFVKEHQHEAADGYGQADWVDDEDAPRCMRCSVRFNLLRRRHHCRLCGFVVCSRCSPHRVSAFGRRVRSCDVCQQNHGLPSVLDAAQLAPTGAGAGGGAVMLVHERRAAAAGPGRHQTVGNSNVFAHDRTQHHLGEGGLAAREEAERAGNAAETAAAAEAAFAEGMRLRQFGYARARQQQAAVVLLERAAGMGHEEALFVLGECCRDGRGAGQDEVRAWQCFEEGARGEHAPSMYWAGHCLFHGYGTARDRLRAEDLMNGATSRFAAGIASPDCQYRLAVAHAAGRGAEKNPARALELMLSAADGGHVPAMFAAAQAYHRGALGAAPDHDRARELYQRAAEAGPHPGAANLVKMV